MDITYFLAGIVGVVAGLFLGAMLRAWAAQEENISKEEYRLAVRAIHSDVAMAAETKVQLIAELDGFVNDLDKDATDLSRELQDVLGKVMAL